MEYTHLGGPEGPRVSTLCLGTLPFGTRIDETAAFAVLDRFHEAAWAPSSTPPTPTPSGSRARPAQRASW